MAMYGGANDTVNSNSPSITGKRKSNGNSGDPQPGGDMGPAFRDPPMPAANPALTAGRPMGMGAPPAGAFAGAPRPMMPPPGMGGPMPGGMPPGPPPGLPMGPPMGPPPGALAGGPPGMAGPPMGPMGPGGPGPMPPPGPRVPVQGAPPWMRPGPQLQQGAPWMGLMGGEQVHPALAQRLAAARGGMPG